MVHFTRDGTFDKFIDGGDGRYRYTAQIVRAENEFKAILNMKPKPMIRAQSPVGCFKYRINVKNRDQGGVKPDWIKAVCFSETPIAELSSFYQATTQRRNEYRKFGLAFWQNFVRIKGGNPVLYVDTSTSTFHASLDQMILPQVISNFISTLPFYQHFGRRWPCDANDAGSIDFRWEREWRVPKDFEFDFSDVAFGICAQDRITEFESLVLNKFPFIDPDWDIPTIKAQLTIKGFSRLLMSI